MTIKRRKDCSDNVPNNLQLNAQSEQISFGNHPIWCRVEVIIKTKVFAMFQPAIKNFKQKVMIKVTSKVTLKVSVQATDHIWNTQCRTSSIQVRSDMRLMFSV